MCHVIDDVSTFEDLNFKAFRAHIEYIFNSEEINIAIRKSLSVLKYVLASGIFRTRGFFLSNRFISVVILKHCIYVGNYK